MEYTIATTGQVGALRPVDERNGWALIQFDTLDEQIELATSRLPAVNAGAADYLSVGGGAGRYGAPRWFGAPSLSEALRRLVEGHPEGMALVEKLLDQLPPPPAPVSVRRVRRWGDTGDAVDMQRVYAGTLDRAFQRSRRESQRAPRIVRMVVDMVASHTVKAETMAWRGAAALAIAGALTQAGYAVEIAGWISCANAYSGKGRPAGRFESLAQLTTLKPAHAPLDLLTLSGALTLMAYTRFVGFSVCAHAAAKVGEGYGSPCAPEQSPFWRTGDLGGFSACVDAATAAKHVASLLAALGADGQPPVAMAA